MLEGEHSERKRPFPAGERALLGAPPGVHTTPVWVHRSPKSSKQKLTVIVLDVQRDHSAVFSEKSEERGFKVQKKRTEGKLALSPRIGVVFLARSCAIPHLDGNISCVHSVNNDHCMRNELRHRGSSKHSMFFHRPTSNVSTK